MKFFFVQKYAGPYSLPAMTVRIKCILRRKRYRRLCNGQTGLEFSKAFLTKVTICA